MFNKIIFLILLFIPINIIGADTANNVSTFYDNSYKEYLEERDNYNTELYNLIAISLKDDDIEILKNESYIDLLSSIKVTGYMSFFDMIIALDKVNLFTYSIDNNLINFKKNRLRYTDIIINNRSVKIAAIVKDKLDIVLDLESGFKISKKDIKTLQDGETIVKEHQTDLDKPLIQTQKGDKSFYYYGDKKYDALGSGSNFVVNSDSLIYKFYKDHKNYIYTEDRVLGPYDRVVSIIPGKEGREVFYITESNNKYSLFTLDKVLLENLDWLKVVKNDYQNVFTYNVGKEKHIYIPGVMKRVDNYTGDINVDKKGIYYNYSKDINSNGWKNVDSKKLNFMLSNNLELGPYESIRKITENWFQGYAGGESYIFNRDGFRHGPFRGESRIQSYFTDIITVDDIGIINTPIEIDRIKPFKKWRRDKQLLIINNRPLKVLTRYGVIEFGERAELKDFSEHSDSLTFTFEDNSVTRIDVNLNDFSKSTSRTFLSTDREHKGNDFRIVKHKVSVQGSTFQALGDFNYASYDYNTKLLGPYPKIISYAKREDKEFLFIKDFDNKYYLTNRDRSINKNFEDIKNDYKLGGSFRFFGSGEDLERSIVLSISSSVKYFTYFSFDDSFYRGIQAGLIKGDKIAYIPLSDDNNDSYYQVTLNNRVIQLPEYTLVQRIGLDSSGTKLLAADPSGDYIYYIDETGIAGKIEQNNRIDYLKFLGNSTDYFFTNDYEMFNTKTGENQRVKIFKNNGQIVGGFNYQTKAYIDNNGKSWDLSGYQDYSLKQGFILLENDRDSYIFLNSTLHGPSSTFIDKTVDNKSNSFVYYNRDRSSYMLYFDGDEFLVKELLNKNKSYNEYYFPLDKDRSLYVIDNDNKVKIISTDGLNIDISDLADNKTEFYYDSEKVYWYHMNGNTIKKYFIKRY